MATSNQNKNFIQQLSTALLSFVRRVGSAAAHAFSPLRDQDPRTGIQQVTADPITKRRMKKRHS